MKRIIILMMDGTIYTKNLTEEDNILLSTGMVQFAQKNNIDRSNIIRVHYVNDFPKIIEL